MTIIVLLVWIAVLASRPLLPRALSTTNVDDFDSHVDRSDEVQVDELSQRQRLLPAGQRLHWWCLLIFACEKQTSYKNVTVTTKNMPTMKLISFVIAHANCTADKQKLQHLFWLCEKAFHPINGLQSFWAIKHLGAKSYKLHKLVLCKFWTKASR